MNKMQKILCIMLCLLMVVAMTACGKKEDAAQKVASEQNQEVKSEQTQDVEPEAQETVDTIAEADALLQGKWVSLGDEDVYSEWTFDNGTYIVWTYINGEKIDNPSEGVYTLTDNEIKTRTTDQARAVEGSIPYTLEDGKLVLHGATGKLVKDSTGK